MTKRGIADEISAASVARRKGRRRMDGVVTMCEVGLLKRPRHYLRTGRLSSLERAILLVSYLMVYYLFSFCRQISPLKLVNLLPISQ